MANKKKGRVSLDVLKPEKEGDRWESIAIVSVSGMEEGEEPEVVIFQNGERIDADPLDDDGKIRQPLSFSAAGEYLIEVRVGDHSVRRRVRISKEKGKAPAAPEILKTNFLGHSGAYEVHALVLGKDEAPLKGIEVRFNTNSEDVRIEPKKTKTDESGSAECRCVINGSEEIVLSVFVNARLFEHLTLCGPWPDEVMDTIDLATDLSSPHS